jgi:hypothetical protein
MGCRDRFLGSFLQWVEGTTSHSVNALLVKARQRFRPFDGRDPLRLGLTRICRGEEAARVFGDIGCVGRTRGLTEARQQCTGLRSRHIEAMVRHW